MKIIQFLSISLVLSFSFMKAGIAAETGKTPEFKYPAIKGHGGIVIVPDAAHAPRKNAKVVIDVTSGKKSGNVLKALDRSALFLNLYEQAGQRETLQYAIVLHGAATKAALSDEGYAAHFRHYKGGQEKTTNPNLPLIRKLVKAGVEVFVCGQSLAQDGFSTEEVAPEIAVAVSAGTAIINLQNEGYAYMPYF